MCDNAVVKNTVGFNPHPYDCTQYVQCYYKGSRVEPVYRECEYGQFWDQAKFKCLPAEMVDCPHDKCKVAGTKHYKHSDPNKCGAYWDCQGGVPKGMCCPEGQAFHPTKGCIPSPTCVDMCPLKDRVPGCTRRPISGAPTKFEQYTDNGEWKRENCPPKAAYNPSDCDCTLTDLIVPGRVCKPEIKINFDKGIEDVSGNNVYELVADNVLIHNKAGYFNGRSSLLLKKVKPSPVDEGVLIVKMKYAENLKHRNATSLQSIMTNGHCGKKPSVFIAKVPGVVMLGAETNSSKALTLPTVNKPTKEIIFIHDQLRLEGRVCGAVSGDWCYGKIRETGCNGFMIGMSADTAGYVGLLDDIEIYRCKPLDAVLNLNY